MPEPANLGAAFHNLTSLVGADDNIFHQLDWELDSEYDRARHDLTKIANALRIAHSHFKQYPTSNHPSISEKNSPRDQALLKLTVILDILRILEATAFADIQNDPLFFTGSSGFDYLYGKLKTDMDAARARLERKQHSISAPPAGMGRALASEAQGVKLSGPAGRSAISKFRVRRP